jgi:hypothetical protein
MMKTTIRRRACQAGPERRERKGKHGATHDAEVWDDPEESCDEPDSRPQGHADDPQADRVRQ